MKSDRILRIEKFGFLASVPEFRCYRVSVRRRLARRGCGGGAGFQARNHLVLKRFSRAPGCFCPVFGPFSGAWKPFPRAPESFPRTSEPFQRASESSQRAPDSFRGAWKPFQRAWEPSRHAGKLFPRAREPFPRTEESFRCGSWQGSALGSRLLPRRKRAARVDSEVDNFSLPGMMQAACPPRSNAAKPNP